PSSSGPRWNALSPPVDPSAVKKSDYAEVVCETFVRGKERAMRSISVTPLAVALAMAGTAGGAALADVGMRVSGPFVHDNLAIYLVHGASVAGSVPLTLQEAVAKGQVQVSETGRVNELEIENTGSQSVFIQAGDIVKGGRQDRVLTVSFLLPANSGRLPIASYCVEQGRWSARGGEDQKRFSSAGEAMPSRPALLATAAPAAPKEPSQTEAGLNPPSATAALSQRVAREVDEVASKQRQVWGSAASTPRELSQGLDAPVASPQSAASLQVALGNAKLKGAQPARREGGGYRRLCRCRQRPQEFSQPISLQRALPKKVGQAAASRRPRSDRRGWRLGASRDAPAGPCGSDAVPGRCREGQEL